MTGTLGKAAVPGARGWQSSPGLADCLNEGKPWEARLAADVWAEHKVRVPTAAAALPPPASLSE